MCIKHHTHCSVESVTERGTTAPSLSSCVEQVDGLSKTEQCNVSDQGIEVEGTFRDVLKHDAAKTHCTIYNI